MAVAAIAETFRGASVFCEADWTTLAEEALEATNYPADMERGRTLVRTLLQACRDTGSPVVPTPIAAAIRALGDWSEETHDDAR